MRIRVVVLFVLGILASAGVAYGAGAGVGELLEFVTRDDRWIAAYRIFLVLLLIMGLVRGVTGPQSTFAVGSVILVGVFGYVFWTPPQWLTQWFSDPRVQKWLVQGCMYAASIGGTLLYIRFYPEEFETRAAKIAWFCTVGLGPPAVLSNLFF